MEATAAGRGAWALDDYGRVTPFGSAPTLIPIVDEWLPGLDS